MTNVQERSIAIPVAEWTAVAERLGHFLASDEDAGIGHVELSVSEGRRRWVGCNGKAIACFLGGRIEAGGATALAKTASWLGAERPALQLSPRLVSAASALTAQPGEDVLLELGVDERSGRPLTTVSGSAGRLSLLAGTGSFPDLDEVVRREDGSGRATAVVDRAVLRRILDEARKAPLGVDTSETRPLFWLEVGQGELRISIDWKRHGTSLFAARAETIGSGAAAAALCCVDAFVEACSDGPLSIAVPCGSGPVLLEDGRGFCVRVLPHDASAESLRERVEHELAGAWGLEEVERDEDGDYVLPNRLAPLYARLLPGDPHRLHLFGLVADLPPSAKLLTELNELNSGLGLLKVFAAADQVVVAADLDATCAGADEIAARARSLARTAADLRVVLAGLFGGTEAA